MKLHSLIALSLLAACGGASEPVEPPRAPAGASAAPADPAPLTFDVFTSGEAGFYTTSTLIAGQRDAILVDAQFNLSSARELAAWIAERDVSLTAIVVSHAHPDHYFGAEAVLEAFPGTPVYATPEVVEHMKELGPAKLAYWGPIYGDDLTTAPIVATPLESRTLELEGRAVELITVDADAHPMTVVHVPSIDLVVAADLAYSDVHVWLAETPAPADRARWLDSITAVQALGARAVVPGHKGPHGVSTPATLDWTRAYIEAFEAARTRAGSPAELQAAMVERYPDPALPIILELAAGAAY